MARTVNKNKNREAENFNQVIEDICKGKYALVLGSEVMLDKNYNIEADGDSTRFFLEQIIGTRRENGFNLKPSENFTRFIIDNALNADNVRGWLLDKIAEWRDRSILGQHGSHKTVPRSAF